MGLCVVSVLSVMILCCGLVSLCLCVYDLKLCGSLCGLPCVLCCQGSVMLLTAGQARGEPLPGCPERHHPGGGQRRGASPVGSGLSSRKIEKENA